MSFPAPHWKWRFLELWLILSLFISPWTSLSQEEKEKRYLQRSAAGPSPRTRRQDRIVTRASAELKISHSCHRTFRTPPLDKISSLFPWCELKTRKFHLAMPNSAQALLGLQCHAVNNQTQAFCKCGSDHSFKIYLIPGTFHTLHGKICAAVTTVDLTVFEISLAQIDGFSLYNIHIFQCSISLPEAPV